MEHKISNELPPLPTEGTTPDKAPSPEYQSQEALTEKQSSQALEKGVPQAANPVQQQQAQIVPIPLTDNQPQQPASQPAVGTQTPIIADDSDLIEKEWVLKAKEIVARTRHDPYLQNKEVERMKADYMRKRYNKEVKVTED